MSKKVWIRGLVGFACSGWGASIWGQADSGSGAPASTPLSMANPAMNPYLNPYLNPALANQRAMSGQDAAMYLFMANSARGGLGSGRISGTRPGPTPPAGSPTTTGGAGQTGRVGPTGAPLVNGRATVGALNQPAGSGAHGARGGLLGRMSRRAEQQRSPVPVGEMPNTAAVPGSGAAGYFNTGGGPTRGAASYFGRSDTYFNNNRR